MCGCNKKAGPGNKRASFSPAPIPTRITSVPIQNTNLNQQNNTTKLPINNTPMSLNQQNNTTKLPINNTPMSLNQNVNINSLANTRNNILRRSVYEQARIKALKNKE